MEALVNDSALNRYNPNRLNKKGPTPFVAALQTANQGEVLTPCPFGCGIEDHDELHRCHHYVGTTVPYKHAKDGENRQMMEPLVRDVRGNLVTSGKRVPVPEGCVLVQISTCSRVYDPKAVKPVSYDEDESPEEETDDEETLVGVKR